MSNLKCLPAFKPAVGLLCGGFSNGAKLTLEYARSCNPRERFHVPIQKQTVIEGGNVKIASNSSHVKNHFLTMCGVKVLQMNSTSPIYYESFSTDTLPVLFHK